ncbi:MAG TPA: hypothetical protein VGO52_03930 [Hyphomonadaceae bacterium]|jgi:hypothetical protein|nr:hypothetical protein [Hyphomonadaceae bacterium]
MAIRHFLLALPLLAACQPAPAPPTQATTQAPQASAEKLDPFVVMIGAERWGVIIDKALDGVREAPDPTSDQRMEDDMYRADGALKSSAARLIELRNAACVKGLVTGDACELRNWPAWTMEPPKTGVPIEEIERRSDWLSAEMDRFTSAGCDAGKKATGEDPFCSVE